MLLIVVPVVYSADFSSGSFTVRDPVIAEYGGNSTSTSFEQLSSGGQAAIGESTSSSFIVKSGFLYFSDVITSSPPPPTPTPTPLPTGGGGGPLAPIPAPISGVVFGGIGYPLQPVYLLKDGQLTTATTADINGEFILSAGDLNSGDYSFGLMGEDVNGQRGAVFYLIHFEENLSQRIDDVLLPPTIALDKNNIFGQTAPLAEVTLTIGNLTKKVAANNLGIYLLPHKNLGLKNGSYQVKSQATLVNGRKTPFSREVTLDLEAVEQLPEKPSKCPPKGDLNLDCRVNLVDLSIMAYWWKRPALPARVDLNGDGIINLVDFSILVYYWTG